MRVYARAFVLAAVVVSTIFASADAFRSDLAAKVGRATPGGAVVGKDGWLFFAPELRGLLAGKFWNETSGPLPVILDFKSQLDRARVELLFVPVPAKATIYPEKISDAGSVDPRNDSDHASFQALLRQRGVDVLDLVPEFLNHRAESPLYCKQDTHWSGRACELAAGLIAARIRTRPWCTTVPRRTFDSEVREIEIAGDLWRMLADPRPPQEHLLVRVVGEKISTGLAPLQPDRRSPVLLLGDSHNLVFHAGGDMHATGAGLPDQLARELGFPVDLIAVRGSGATPSRVNLARRNDNLAGKRIVIWCVSVREYTDGQGWQKVPVLR